MIKRKFGAAFIAALILAGCGAGASESEPEVSGGRFEWVSVTAKVSLSQKIIRYKFLN